jgi:hypothetical protein
MLDISPTDKVSESHFIVVQNNLKRLFVTNAYNIFIIPIKSFLTIFQVNVSVCVLTLTQ